MSRAETFLSTFQQTFAQQLNVLHVCLHRANTITCQWIRIDFWIWTWICHSILSASLPDCQLKNCSRGAIDGIWNLELEMCDVNRRRQNVKNVCPTNKQIRCRTESSSTRLLIIYGNPDGRDSGHRTPDPKARIRNQSSHRQLRSLAEILVNIFPHSICLLFPPSSLGRGPIQEAGNTAGSGLRRLFREHRGQAVGLKSKMAAGYVAPSSVLAYICI